MSTQQTSQDNPLADFGPNEWIVEDMYQRYLADPTSVDPAWHDFFADYRPEVPSAAGTVATSPGTATATSAPTSTPVTAPTKVDQRPPATATAAAPTAPAKPAPARTAPAAPATPAAPAGGKPAAKAAKAPATAAPTGAKSVTLRGVAARIAQNMDQSLTIPTATSVRAVPAKLIADNRIVINNHLARGRGGKVSFTHLIGYAVVKALAVHPEMNCSYAEVDGKPTLVEPEHVNLGIAIDLQRPDGSRTLVVPSIKAAETMDFRQFWQAYEDVVRRARKGELTMDDYAGTTISLTNPGGIGTVHSMPRLMAGQGTIIGVGAMEYPAPFAGMSEEQLAENAVSKIMTLTSTYDHRIIQGAQSGEFLKAIHELLLGEHDFFDEIFTALRIPYEPVRWVRDVARTSEGQIDKTARIIELIHAYRVRGHLMADTDPLEFRMRRHPDLDVLEHGLTLWDLDRTFPVGGFAGKQKMKLREVLGVLRDSYCRRVGVEYMHIQDPEERRWIQERVERKYEKPSADEQKHILQRLNAAEAFETFLQTKYVGQRRFSLEGGESLIPLLDEVLQEAASNGLDEVVIGMAHRGRLNVLANIVGKPYEKIFSEFEGHLDPSSAQGSGDVKYHLGMTGKYTTRDDEHSITVSVVANPSHLEAVDPVLEGIVRAKQDRIDLKLEGYTVLPVLVHGDAAFAGQGVVAETLNLSQLRGYRTGGTVHVVVNNQVGFTTAPEYSRSSLYSTDVARMIQAPIFHVNGDDPEAVVHVSRIAIEFRQKFKKDVVVDLFCYRRHGHNEGDEPAFTQPLMYRKIASHPTTRTLYAERLVAEGAVSADEAQQMVADFQAHLESQFEAAKGYKPNKADWFDGRWAKLGLAQDDERRGTTGVAIESLKEIGRRITAIPQDFKAHRTIERLLHRRREMVETGTGVDWAMAESLAFGSLLAEGYPVRLSGQDSERGTFSQRHAVLTDQET
ncbi:MAG TPA: multifunctional oxoglutarate decarboxylase/oxoglutarate dehydrogenase thiamine pyrophosphate-binding subunit/dihydrolipoyllysine-residue succinyltransferase subunit, partial [Micromonosporaceae bacterium]